MEPFSPYLAQEITSACPDVVNKWVSSEDAYLTSCELYASRPTLPGYHHVRETANREVIAYGQLLLASRKEMRTSELIYEAGHLLLAHDRKRVDVINGVLGFTLLNTLNNEIHVTEHVDTLDESQQTSLRKQVILNCNEIFTATLMDDTDAFICAVLLQPIRE